MNQEFCIPENADVRLFPAVFPVFWRKCLDIILEDMPEISSVHYSGVRSNEDVFFVLAFFMKSYCPAWRIRELHLRLVRYFSREGGNIRFAFARDEDKKGSTTPAFLIRVKKEGKPVYRLPEARTRIFDGIEFLRRDAMRLDAA